MKKILFSLLTAAFSLTFLYSQQVNYYVNMVGSPGQSFVIAQDDTIQPSDMSFNTGPVGAGQIWNFQGLDANNLDTLFFQTPNGQEATDFPGCNLVMESNAGRIVFDKNVSTGLFLMGTALTFQGIPLALNYAPIQEYLPPVDTLGATAHTVSYVNEIVYTGIDTTYFTCHIVIDSIKLKRRSDFTVKIDAAGELRLPLDTFPHTVRSISKEITLDSIFIYSTPGISCGFINAPPGWSLAPDVLIQLSGFATGAVVLDSSFTASWYNPYTISPVCIVDFTYDSLYTDTNFVTARFKGDNTPDIGFEQQTTISLNLYPNPATNMLILQTTANLNDATMYIFNAQGQEVKTTNFNGSNTVDVSGLTNGIYFYRLATGNQLMHQGKFIVKR